MITWDHKDDKLIKLTRAKNFYNINNKKIYNKDKRKELHNFHYSSNV